MTRRAAVTGANGFIGRALAAQLRERGPLRGLFRQPSDLSAAWQARGDEVVFGDLHDDAALRALVADVDVVYHLAARMAKDDAAESRRVNVDGTERLARAAHAAGVQRLVYVSSISVYSATPAEGDVLTEAAEPRDVHTLNPYSATKYEGEQTVRALAERGEGPAFTIVRPTNVYGPWGKAWFLDFVRQLEKVPLTVGVNVPIDVVHVDDVAAGLIAAAEADAGADEVFHLGHETIALADFVDRVGGAIGRKVRRLPRALDAATCAVAEWSHRLLKGTGRSLSLTRRVHYPHDKARRLVGYAPSVGVDEGFAALARWYREEYRVV